MGDYTIRELQDGDVESLLASVARTFGPRAARTREQWEWAFARNPAGRRSFVALHGSEVVGQFAAIPTRVWLDGRERVFAQGVDSFVLPEHRAGLKRPGLFVAIARACFEAHAARTGRDGDPVYYGLPVEQAWRIGNRFLGYEVVRTELALARELAPTGELASGGKLATGDELALGHAAVLPRNVARIERFDEQAKWLWDRCAGEWPASAIRDAAHLNWRLFDSPASLGRRCEVLGARDEHGILRGFVAWRRASFVLDDLAVLVDWCVPFAEPDVGEALLAALVASAAASGAPALAGIVPPWSPWFAWFQERGFLVHPTDYRMAAVSFERRFDAAWLATNWWYQLSDTDLV
ncbi:MAG: GNAT family N-acetyltransferase [Planctomycetes bacterium]|nr:GNAT family N-acetyltransferase [Planctomycetota bacterium]